MKGKRGCRFGCFHIELKTEEDEKNKVLCRKGWPRVRRARFSRLQYETKDLEILEEFKNENPHVFQAQRDHPFEGMSNPFAQVFMRCNVDVKYLGRAFAAEDLTRFCDGTFDLAAVTTESEVMAESSTQSAVGLRDAATHLELRPDGARSRPDMSEASLHRMDVDQDFVAESEVPVVLLEGASMQSAVGDHDTAVASDLQPDGTRSRTDMSEESLYQMDVDQNAASSMGATQPTVKRRRETTVPGRTSQVDKKKSMRLALERILVDMSRDMQDVGFYTGEYAAKKFEISRSMLPELHSGQILWFINLLVLR